MKQESITKVLVFIGYFLLIILAGVGIISLYLELQKISSVQESGADEIITVSNVLATLYESENAKGYLFPQNTPPQDNIRDSLIQKIIDDIAILRMKSNDSIYISKLDSVVILINLKLKNEKKMVLLMDSIMQLPSSQRQVVTVLSQKDLSNLESIIRNRDTQIIDSTSVIIRKKSFFEKISDLFNSKAVDSISLNIVQQKEIMDSLVPIKHTTDTIAQYMTDYIVERNLRYAVLTSQLSARQFHLQNTNEVLLSKINFILKRLEEKELKRRLEIEDSKEQVLTDSAYIGYIVASAAVVVMVLFLSWILQLINRQISYRRQLEKSKARTDYLLVNKEQLMLSISHDIKAPLSSIIGYIEILSKVKLPAREKYFLKNMQISSEEILELVMNLLDYHKLDSGKFTLNSINFSPYTFVNDIYYSFIPIAKSKSLSLSLNNEIDQSKIYVSDPFRIKQIINNLISNALKFTKKGGVEIDSRIESNKDKQWFIISVKDTGIGISKNNLHVLFKQYERAKTVEEQNIEGSGMGLAISQKLAQLLDGEIVVNSELGVGSTFTLKFPICETEKSKIITNMQENNLSQESQANLLFIDDDSVLLHVYFEMLKQHGYEARLCDSSLKALEILQNQKIDIVFCDIQMPNMNGFELVERIRNATFPDSKNIPVVALSARSDVPIQTYKEAGFTNFLSKPFTAEQLLSMIDSLGRPGSATESNLDCNKEKSSDAEEKGFHSLIAFAEGDEDASKLILETFIDENIKVVLHMKESLESKDWTSIQSSAHKLLPRMRMIGDEELVSILYRIEKGEENPEKLIKAFTLIEKKNEEAIMYITKVSKI